LSRLRVGGKRRWLKEETRLASIVKIFDVGGRSRAGDVDVFLSHTQRFADLEETGWKIDEPPFRWDGVDRGLQTGKL
jgi:hypothetical protein